MHTPPRYPKYQWKSVTVIMTVHPKGCMNPWYTLAAGNDIENPAGLAAGSILLGSDKEGSGRSGNQLNRKLRIKANTAKVPAGVSSPGSSWNSIYYPPPPGIHRPVDPRGRRHHTGGGGGGGIGGALTQRYSRGTPPSIVVFQQCCFAVCLRVIGKLGPASCSLLRGNKRRESFLPSPSDVIEFTWIVLGEGFWWGNTRQTREIGVSSADHSFSLSLTNVYDAIPLFVKHGEVWLHAVRIRSKSSEISSGLLREELKHCLDRFHFLQIFQFFGITWNCRLHAMLHSLSPFRLIFHFCNPIFAPSWLYFHPLSRVKSVNFLSIIIYGYTFPFSTFSTEISGY